MSEDISAPFSFLDSSFVLDPIRYTEGHLHDTGVYIYKTLELVGHLVFQHPGSSPFAPLRLSTRWTTFSALSGLS